MKTAHSHKLISVPHGLNGEHQAAKAAELFDSAKRLSTKYGVSISGFEYKSNGDFSEIWCDWDTICDLAKAGHDRALNVFFSYLD